jgi:hypothetical protein
MPGRSGVTAPIVPDNRTTGTTADPRCHRSGINFISAAFILGNLCQLSYVPDSHTFAAPY